MYSLSKIGLVHKLVNKEYDIFSRIIIAFLFWLCCISVSFDYKLSNILFRRIIFLNDLKSETRRLVWIIKRSFYIFPIESDLLFDFCNGLNKNELRTLKKKLESNFPKKDNLISELDLLKIYAYEINFVPNNNFEKNNYFLYKNFLDQYYKVKELIEKNSNNYLIEEKTNNKFFNKKFGMNTNNALKVLNDLSNLFEINNIDWFAICGTFLGFVRERSFLKHDLDIDIGIMANTVTINTLQNILENSSCFKVSKVEFQKEFISNSKSIVRDSFVRIVHKNGINIDLYWHYHSQGKISHGTSTLLWENTEFNLLPYEVYGIMVRGPENANLYLTETYGDWIKEKINYNFHLDMLSLKAAPNYLGLEYLLRKKILYGQAWESEILNLEKLLLYDNYYLKYKGDRSFLN